MSYHCGIGEGLPISAQEPHILCDICGFKFYISTKKIPPAWFLDGKAPRGWKKVIDGESRRYDYCKKCLGRKIAIGKVDKVTDRYVVVGTAKWSPLYWQNPMGIKPGTEMVIFKLEGTEDLLVYSKEMLQAILSCK